MSKELFNSRNEVNFAWTKVGAIVSALVITGALLIGYGLIHKHQLEKVNAAKQAKLEAQSPPAPIAQIFVNEAQLKGSQAIISGTVRNISQQNLDGLAVEIELKRRADNKSELRMLRLEPETLQPGEVGHYSLEVIAKEWSGIRITRLYSNTDNKDLAFTSEIGERRPLEHSSQSKPKIVIIPHPKSKNDGFINTPDNPIPIH